MGETTNNGMYIIFAIICVIFACLRIFSKYFLETTDIGKMESGLYSMLWIILGMVNLLFYEIGKLKK